MELKYPANGQRSRRGTTQTGSEQSLSEGAGKPKRMDKEWTDVFFWMATVVAGLIAAAVFAVYLFSETGNEQVAIVPLVFAGAIWLIAWAASKVFARRKE
jgi:hypothetical protein